jgi:transposase
MGSGMRNDVEVRLGPGDRERLEAVLADRNSPQKHVWRARIILATAEGCGTTEVMRRAGVSKPCVWRWQRRFMEAGVDGLLRDKTRKPGKAPVSDQVVARQIERTLGDPPGETTHWTSRAMASAMGLAISTVQKIWRAHGLAPHRLRTFKRSRNPHFAAKLRDVVGLYVDPPAHAVVLSVDEKSQVQALDRTQPGLPMKRGRAGTMTHDYGTTTLFAALNILDGTVIGQCMQRHRHQEFLRFLNRLERDIPAGRLVHVVPDNYGSHTHPKVRVWWHAIRAGSSISRPPRRRGSMRLKVSSLSSRAAACNGACSVPRRPASRDQPLPRRSQRQPETIHLDRRPRYHHRCRKPSVITRRVSPTAS